jgi:phytanoyl-CoA hydroxylase
MKNAPFYDHPERFLQSANRHVRALMKDGFCVVDKAVDTRLIDAFLDRWHVFKKTTVEPHATQLVEGDDMINGRFRRMVNMHLALPELQRLFERNAALPVVDELFGEPTTLYTSLYFEIGSAQDPHRDTPYFWTNPGYAYFGVWLALEDTDEDNGALTAIKGSHLVVDSLSFREEIGKLDLDESGKPKAHSSVLWSSYQNRVRDLCLAQGLKLAPLPVSKGDVIIWHPQLMHGGGEIKDRARSRNSFVMHVTPRSQLVYAMDKYFDPAAELPSLNPSIKYRETSAGRLVRDDGMWAIAQKVFLPATGSPQASA